MQSVNMSAILGNALAILASVFVLSRAGVSAQVRIESIFLQYKKVPLFRTTPAA